MRPDAVVHLAALSSVAASWGSSSAVWRVNALGTVHVLEAVRHEVPGRPRAVRLHGRGVRRATPTARARTAAPAPVSPYAASKAAAETACGQAVARERARRGGRPPYAHVGPGQDERFAVGSWTRQIARLERDGGGALLVGDLTAERDLTDVRDVCRAYPPAARPRRPRRHVQRRVGRGGRPRSGRRAPRRPRPGAGARRARPRPAAAQRPAPPGGRRDPPARGDRLGAHDCAGHDTRRRARGCARRSRGGERHEQACADHGGDGPGRLVPRGVPARAGLRGVRHGAPRLHRELRAHRPPHRSHHAGPGRPARPVLARQRPRGVAAAARSTTWRRRASCRPPGSSPC